MLFDFSKTSGRICKNALPIKEPAEKPIRQNRIPSNNFSFMAKVNTPIREIRLTRSVLVKIKTRTIQDGFLKD